MKDSEPGTTSGNYLHDPENPAYDRYLIRQSGKQLAAAASPAPYLELLENHTSLLKIYKDRPSVRVFAVNGVLIKQFRFHGFLDILRHRLTVPRILINLRASEFIAELGINTPEIFLVCREKWHGQSHCSDYVFFEELPGTTEFGDQSLRPWQEIARSALQTVAGLHEHGVEHGDASLRNMYFTDGGKFPMGVLDLDNCRIAPRPVRLDRRIKEAARIASSLYWTRIRSRNEAPALPETAEYCRKVYAEFSGIELNRRLFNGRINEFFTHHDYYKGIDKLQESDWEK